MNETLEFANGLTLVVCNCCGSTRSARSDGSNGSDGSSGSAVGHWEQNGQALDPSVGFQSAFGSFDLIGEVDSIGAPSRHLLVTVPDSREAAGHLRSLPLGLWIEVMDGLHVCHRDGVLLLAPRAPTDLASVPDPTGAGLKPVPIRSNRLDGAG